MKEITSPLFSQYIIDGVQCDATPYELLSECMEYPSFTMQSAEHYEDIVDESIDPPVTSFRYDSENNMEYVRQVHSFNGYRAFRMLYPETFTRQKIASALLDRIWNKGHYKLGNLNIVAEWEWNSRPVGNMASFYNSVRSAGEYIYDLGCRIEDFSVEESDTESNVKFTAVLREPDHEEEGIKSSPYESRHPWMEEGRMCPDKLYPCRESQVIYIPFDTASFKLGGSLLAELNGHNGGSAPHIMDPDYFIDCYEVVREMIEDGIIMSGTTISDGGIAKAIADMCRDCGIDINISGISSSYLEDDSTRILFSEIPGVLIQVSESNMDYIDSQLILQDVAYYSIGFPKTKDLSVNIKGNNRAAIADLLSTLIIQASEGED